MGSTCTYGTGSEKIHFSTLYWQKLIFLVVITLGQYFLCGTALSITHIHFHVNMGGTFEKCKKMRMPDNALLRGPLGGPNII